MLRAKMVDVDHSSALARINDSEAMASKVFEGQSACLKVLEFRPPMCDHQLHIICLVVCVCHIEEVL